MLTGLFVIVGVAALVYVIGAMASGIGIIAGFVSLFVAPVKRPVQTALDPRVSRTREDIMQDPIRGTYAWDLMIAEEERIAANKAARRSRRHKAQNID